MQKLAPVVAGADCRHPRCGWDWGARYLFVARVCKLHIIGLAFDRDGWSERAAFVQLGARRVSALGAIVGPATAFLRSWRRANTGHKHSATRKGLAWRQPLCRRRELGRPLWPSWADSALPFVGFRDMVEPDASFEAKHPDREREHDNKAATIMNTPAGTSKAKARWATLATARRAHLPRMGGSTLGLVATRARRPQKRTVAARRHRLCVLDSGVRSLASNRCVAAPSGAMVGFRAPPTGSGSATPALPCERPHA